MPIVSSDILLDMMIGFVIGTWPNMHSSFQMVVNCSTILISTSLDFFLYSVKPSTLMLKIVADSSE